MIRLRVSFAIGFLIPCWLHGRAEGAESSRFIYSPVGPRVGQSTLSLGVKAYRQVPSIDFHWVYGVAKRVDFRLEVSSLAILTLADLGASLRLMGDERSTFSMGVSLRGNAMAFAVLSGEEPGEQPLSPGIGGGLRVGLGGAKIQLTLGCDVASYFGGAFAAGFVGARPTEPSLPLLLIEPQVAVEYRAFGEAALHGALSIWLSGNQPGYVFGPISSLGVSW